MRSVFRAYFVVSHGLGSQRRLIRRIAAVCLVLMGVHLAADHLDDLIYSILDSIDLFIDDGVAGFLSWLSSAGGMSPEAAIEKSESFATFVDLSEKDKLAIGVALIVELLLDIMLFNLAWGRHVDEESTGLGAELAASARQMKEALKPLDLERLAVIPTLFAYAFGGAAVAALAVENVVRDVLSRAASEFLWAGHVAAATGLLAAALLVWRFFPDLLHGALLRSRERHDGAREKALKKLGIHHRFPRFYKTWVLLRLGSRGTWLVVFALPLAVAGLMSHDLWGLLSRIEVIPG